VSSDFCKNRYSWLLRLLIEWF